MQPSDLTLIQTEEQFRLLVESVLDYAIFMLDPNGFVVTWNSGAERIKGYTADEIIGTHFRCFYSFEDVALRAPDHQLEMASSVGRFEDEGWRIRKDGSRFWANVIITVMRDTRGNLIGFSKVTRNLTERKRTEDILRASNDALEQRVQDRTAELVQLNLTLRASEERYRLIVEGVRDYAIYTLDSAGSVTSWNEGAARIYGYASHEIVGKSRSRFFTPEDISMGLPQSELNEAIATGRFSEEAWRVRKDGSLFWAHGTMTAIHDDAGALRGFVKIVRDLTERKRAEIKLQKMLSALQLRDQAIRAVPHGIFITDPKQPNNPIIYVSPGFEQLTGYRADEVLNRGIDFLAGSKTDTAIATMVRETIRAGQPSSAEVLNYRKDGTAFWSSQVIAPVRDEQGRLIHFVGVLSDATQRRNLEDQLRQSQKMDAVGQLAGGVAHDFNNLLTVINGYTEVLLAELSSNDPKHHSVAAISEAAKRATELTSQLLTLSRRTVVETQLVDLNKLVSDTERMLRRVIGEDVMFSLVLDPTIGYMKVDPGQIRQVLMNLVVNARDAMPLGGKLTIETKRVELEEDYANTHVAVAAGRYVLLSVTDTGTGMTPEVRSRIFDPFYTTKDTGKGTGLGLSVVHGIVKQSHGHIGAYTELGLGTTFKIYLPAIEEGVPSTIVPVEAPKASSGQETVLLVEDEEAVRRITLRFLQSQGYTVLTAANGKDALHVVKNHASGIDLLLTDVVMPEMNGRQLYEALQPIFPQMKVLFLSGYTDDAIVRHGILQSGVAFLQKPFTSTALLNRVRQVLDQPTQ